MKRRPLRYFSLRKSTISLCLLLASLFSLGQSETHDFITYDTTIAYSCNTGIGGCGSNGVANVFTVRISRPRNYFVAGNADTASRPWLLTMPGLGEVGTDTSYLSRYGPHYWIQHGWDGGVQLENGKHYPILVTLIASTANVQSPFLQALMDTLIKYYHPRKNSLHMAGLSMGVQCLGWYLGYEKTAGDEHNMANVRSFVDLEGEAPGDDANSADPLAYPLFLGHWAKKYGGRFLGLEGTNDSRNIWQITDNINDSIANSGYFAYQSYGGGIHCCWDSMYDPSVTNWQDTAPVTNTHILYPPYFLHPNVMGDYFVDHSTGTNIFQWMIRQGDTSLIGSGTPPPNQPPVANAGPDRVITLPKDTVHLVGSGTDPDGTVVSYAWTKVSGTGGTIVSPSTDTTAITGLTAGIYKFVLTVTDNDGATGRDTMQVTVDTAVNQPPVANAGPDRVITLPKDSVILVGSGTDPDGTIVSYAWTKVSGTGGTIASPSASTTAITGLVAGIYKFVLTVTDNDGATGADTMQVTVDTTAGTTGKTVNVQCYAGTNPYLNSAWNNWNNAAYSTFNSLKYSDASSSAYNVAQTLYFPDGGSDTLVTNSGDNGASYGGTMCPPAVLRYASFSTVDRGIVFSGLDTAIYYDLSFYASRNNTGNNTNFTIDTTTINIVTDDNLTNAATFTNVAAASDGTLTVHVGRGTGATYNYINGFTLTEAGSKSGSRAHAVADSGKSAGLGAAGSGTAVPLTLYPNPASTDQLTVYFRNPVYGKMAVTITDETGTPIQRYEFQKQQDLFTTQLQTTGLAKGLYFIKVTMQGYTQTKTFIKL